jgi:arsenate reductase (thioredoxin)
MTEEKKIIFVCEHGAGKSVIAASYFNKFAKEQMSITLAYYRGLFPEAKVSPAAAAGLTKDDLFDPSIKPQKLSFSDVVGADRVILFTDLPPDYQIDNTEDWSTIANVNAPYDLRRNSIVKKINELLDSLANDNLKCL